MKKFLILYILLLSHFFSYAVSELINPFELDPSIKIEDERYRNTYPLQSFVADALKSAHKELYSYGYGVLVLVRENAQTEVEACDSKLSNRFSPQDRHKYGLAIDITLYDIATGKAVDMGTDLNTLKTIPLELLPEQIRERRMLLKTIMEKYSFEVCTTNWWHFDYIDWFQWCLIAEVREYSEMHPELGPLCC